MFASAGWAAEGERPVRLVLKWYHQFQFAGYYAASAQGYYAEEGLAVEIIEASPAKSPMAAVLKGEADFGVGDTDVLLARMRGQPLVVCAAIFQHSPYVILSRADRGIRSPHDLVGARVMLSSDQGASQFRAMLTQEGVALDRVEIVPQTWRLEDLIEGRVDAMSAYATAEPAQMRARGVEPAMLRTLDYGVDFYGDTLFAREAWVAGNEELTEAFIRASLRGWEHALRNPEKMVDHILALPGVRERGLTRELLLEEAAAMHELIMPDVVEIGHMNAGRWRRIADVLIAQGLAPRNAPLEDFVYDVNPAEGHGVLRRMAAFAGVSGGVAVLVLLWNLQMRRSVWARTRELRAEMARREGTEQELRREEARVRAQLRELERWRDVTLGREERIQALKVEVNVLLAESGRPTRYTPASDASGPLSKP
ncbi:MAG: ABC transporter substrate-binding protein [Burkholderiales bacterium]|nr:ABC transporter substrate-binding protein [Opitutaceae bacterium]